jgi:multidrug efflux pump subunit AcrA (membrane-fusion protein)
MKKYAIQTERQLRQTMHLIEPEFLPFTLRPFEASLINQQATRQGQQHAWKLMRQQALLNEALNAFRRNGECEHLLDFVTHKYGKDRAKRFIDNLHSENEQAKVLAQLDSLKVPDVDIGDIATPEPSAAVQ